MRASGPPRTTPASNGGGSKEKATGNGGLFVCTQEAEPDAFPRYGAGQMLPLLADRARSECARLGEERVSARSGGRVRRMRAAGSTCTHSAVIELEGEEEKAPTKVTFLIS